ncbi:glycosyltransferase family 2 protein [Hymenobacter taeanensis]|uniref:Glycosyltransferase family 2 protein n=1 Tax=Hymenobacter taeanensis TaxID=2735321 RepID=A0A6M6BGE3_9BACT|nr:MULTISPECIES: glycosyltransferase family 2 protein [Hymenobacter]QJX46928.1 glycosyltransferase family 2 protein [Hymenobacter taeanensis]UOQ80804.1 glycosyltransferase family 2 protein [Hymenobacter sp. 5414T-23]
MANPLLSVVIPVFNEEGLVATLVQRTTDAVRSITDDYEIICVDDGSRDQTLALLLAARASDPRLKVLVLSRNFGHQAAYTAGLFAAKGQYVAMMDGDLQDPPELLGRMYELLKDDQYDIVYGHRTDRAEGWARQTLIKIFHGVFRNFSRLKETDNVGNFSMLNQRALQAFLSLKEKNRYLPGLRSFIGYRQVPVPYARQARHDGTVPKMSYKRLIALAFDAVFSFSDLPIKVCLYTGLFGMIICLAGGVWVLVSKALGLAPFGWSSLELSIYFVGCIQLLFLGILGEYVFRIYRENQNRPLYFVQTYFDA